MFTRIRYLSISWPKWIQSTPSYVNKIYFNNIFPLRLVLPGPVFFIFRRDNPVCNSLLSVRTTCSTYFTRLDSMTLTYCEQYKYEVLIMQLFPPPCHFSLLSTHISLSTQCWNTLNARHQVSHLRKIRPTSCYNGRTSINVAVLLETEFEPSFGNQGISQTKFLKCDLTDERNSVKLSVWYRGTIFCYCTCLSV